MGVTNGFPGDTEGLFHIKLLYIHPDHMNQGLGGELLRTLISQAEKDGYTQVELEVLVDNIIAKNFYQKHGFQEHGKPYVYYKPNRKPFPDTNGEPAMVIKMIKDISQH